MSVNDKLMQMSRSSATRVDSGPGGGVGMAVEMEAANGDESGALGSVVEIVSEWTGGHAGGASKAGSDWSSGGASGSGVGKVGGSLGSTKRRGEDPDDRDRAKRPRVISAVTIVDTDDETDEKGKTVKAKGREKEKRAEKGTDKETSKGKAKERAKEKAKDKAKMDKAEKAEKAKDKVKEKRKDKGKGREVHDSAMDVDSDDGEVRKTDGKGKKKAAQVKEEPSKVPIPPKNICEEPSKVPIPPKDICEACVKFKRPCEKPRKGKACTECRRLKVKCSEVKKRPASRGRSKTPAASARRSSSRTKTPVPKDPSEKVAKGATGTGKAATTARPKSLQHPVASKAGPSGRRMVVEIPYVRKPRSEMKRVLPANPSRKTSKCSLTEYISLLMYSSSAPTFTELNSERSTPEAGRTDTDKMDVCVDVMTTMLDKMTRMEDDIGALKGGQEALRLRVLGEKRDRATSPISQVSRVVVATQTDSSDTLPFSEFILSS